MLLLLLLPLCDTCMYNCVPQKLLWCSRMCSMAQQSQRSSPSLQPIRESDQIALQPSAVQSALEQSSLTAANIMSSPYTQPLSPTSAVLAAAAHVQQFDGYDGHFLHPYECVLMCDMAAGVLTLCCSRLGLDFFAE